MALPCKGAPPPEAVWVRIGRNDVPDSRTGTSTAKKWVLVQDGSYGVSAQLATEDLATEHRFPGVLVRNTTSRGANQSGFTAFITPAYADTLLGSLINLTTCRLPSFLNIVRYWRENIASESLTQAVGKEVRGYILSQVSFEINRQTPTSVAFQFQGFANDVRVLDLDETGIPGTSGLDAPVTKGATTIDVTTPGNFSVGDDVWVIDDAGARAYATVKAVGVGDITVQKGGASSAVTVSNALVQNPALQTTLAGVGSPTDTTLSLTTTVGVRPRDVIYIQEGATVEAHVVQAVDRGADEVTIAAPGLANAFTVAATVRNYATPIPQIDDIRVYQMAAMSVDLAFADPITGEFAANKWSGNNASIRTMSVTINRNVAVEGFASDTAQPSRNFSWRTVSKGDTEVSINLGLKFDDESFARFGTRSAIEIVGVRVMQAATNPAVTTTVATATNLAAPSDVAVTFTVADATGIAIGSTLLLDDGTNQDVQKVTDVSGTTITIEKLDCAIANGAAVTDGAWKMVMPRMDLSQPSEPQADGNITQVTATLGGRVDPADWGADPDLADALYGVFSDDTSRQG